MSHSLDAYLILSGLLFSIGIFGFLARRNAIAMLMSIELMLNAVNLAAIAFGVLAGGCGDLDRAIDHDDPRALVHLVVGQALAGREVEHDRARGIARGQDLR